MWQHTVHILALLSLWVSLKEIQGTEATGKPCAHGHFYLESTSTCVPCSGCSDNEVVRKPCSQTADTTCGPFKEFKFFQHHSEVGDKHGKSSQPVAEKTELHLTIYSEGAGHSRGNVAIRETAENQHWRTVAFALIGALSALVFLGTFVVLVTCKRINQSRTPPVQRATDDDDADCPYVVIHTIRPSASDDEVTYQVPPGPNALHQLARQRQRLYKYHPKRRLLQANEYADEVFESEDSAGSRRRISLQAIPETEHSESEAECSPLSSTALPLPSPDTADSFNSPSSADLDPMTTDPVSPRADSVTASPTSEQSLVVADSASPQSSKRGEEEDGPLPAETRALLVQDTQPIAVS